MGESTTRLNRQSVYARVARWSEEVVLQRRNLSQVNYYKSIWPAALNHDDPIATLRLRIAIDQFNAARDEQEEMES